MRPDSGRFSLTLGVLIHETDRAVATPNYGYEKRQKELAKKKKKEDKLKAKAERKTGSDGSNDDAQDGSQGAVPAPSGMPTQT